MNSDQYRELDRLLQAALERPREEREAFLHDACAGNESLERHVRVLLESEPHVTDFLERPAIALAAQSLARKRSDAPHDHADSLIGRTLSHYRIVEKLGGGGMGVVYKAEDVRLHRFVALKFLSDDMAGDVEDLGRFRRVARIASGLNHPNICTIHDIGDQDGHAFITMELLEGSTPKQRIAADQSLDIRTVLLLGMEIADALEVPLTAQAVVHRDVKPANMFVSKRDHAKVLDFGLAKTGGLIARDVESSTLSSAATEVGIFLGTAAYMAPEQARGETVDHRVDIWALGLVLYEMAMGTRPVATVRLRIENAPELERIVSKCLEIDPECRYQRASELRVDLECLKTDTDSRQATRTATARLPSALAERWKTLVSAAAAVVTLSVAGYVYFHRTPTLTGSRTTSLCSVTCPASLLSQRKC